MTDKVTNLNPPIAGDTLAESIVKIGYAADRLFKNGLNKRAVIILIQATTKLPQRDIRAVLEALPQLERLYCAKNAKD